MAALFPWWWTCLCCCWSNPSIIRWIGRTYWKIKGENQWKIYLKVFTRMTENRQSQFFNNVSPKRRTIRHWSLFWLFLIIEYFVWFLLIWDHLILFSFQYSSAYFIALRSLFQASFDKVNKILSIVIALLLVYVFAGQLISSPIFLHQVIKTIRCW